MISQCFVQKFLDVEDKAFRMLHQHQSLSDKLISMCLYVVQSYSEEASNIKISHRDPKPEKLFKNGGEVKKNCLSV